MMIDQDVVAASPTTVHRVLRAAGRLDRWSRRPSKTGMGFDQPLQPHQHPHVDISYVNVAGAFYYLCSILDGCSRFLVHWELREAMEEADVERGHRARPRAALRHFSAHHLRQRAPVHRGRHYNTERLHSAIDYVTPADRLAGRHAAITAERDRRLEAARDRRAQWRQAARRADPAPPPSPASLDSHP